jgi:predicted transcriptional regulator
MRDRLSESSTGLDLRSFRQQLTPRRTLGQVARGAQVDRSLLSRIETGTRAITADCARRLARYYSRVAGRRVTAGEILDMAECASAWAGGRANEGL